MSRAPSFTRKGVLKYEKIRFATVGVFNTATDFSVFFTLASVLGVPTIVANTASTTVALGVSYLLNKKAVFGDTDTTNIKQLALFIGVTLSGLWVLQGAAITIIAPVLQPMLGEAGSLLGAKLIATVFTVVWNYLWYSRVIFKNKKD